MPCMSCESNSEVELVVEMMIHFSGIRNMTTSGVMVCPTALICLNCGQSRFTVPKDELARLGDELGSENGSRVNKILPNNLPSAEQCGK